MSMNLNMSMTLFTIEFDFKSFIILYMDGTELQIVLFENVFVFI